MMVNFLNFWRRSHNLTGIKPRRRVPSDLPGAGGLLQTTSQLVGTPLGEQTTEFPEFSQKYKARGKTTGETNRSSPWSPFRLSWHRPPPPYLATPSPLLTPWHPIRPPTAGVPTSQGAVRYPSESQRTVPSFDVIRLMYWWMYISLWCTKC